jgi:endogenous inhibitor of DNA gyrase (YacG/DUF329 family)
MSLLNVHWSNGVCPYCDKSFTLKRKHQRFCSSRCRLGQWLYEHPRTKVVKHLDATLPHLGANPEQQEGTR